MNNKNGGTLLLMGFIVGCILGVFVTLKALDSDYNYWDSSERNISFAIPDLIEGDIDSITVVNKLLPEPVGALYFKRRD